MTQTKGTEKSSNIIKLKDDKQKDAKTDKPKTDGLDEETQMSIKQLLSHIKLNDKLAIEKSVKELREIAESKSKNGAKEIKGIAFNDDRQIIEIKAKKIQNSTFEGAIIEVKEIWV